MELFREILLVLVLVEAAAEEEVTERLESEMLQE